MDSNLHFLEFCKIYIPSVAEELLTSWVPVEGQRLRTLHIEPIYHQLTNLIATCSLLYKFFPGEKEREREGMGVSSL